MTPQDLWSQVVHGAALAGPDKPAVLATSGQLTYGELLAGAEGIAATLGEAGIGRGDRVGVWMDKTPRCLQVILGVMGSGAAYVPLDPRAPWRRCRTIALDCGFRAFAVDAARWPRIPELFEDAPPALLLVDPPPGEAVPDTHAGAAVIMLAAALERPARAIVPPRAQDIAYVLYTSGSTGTPKGVVHTHASALAFARWVAERFDVTAADRFSSHAPFHFDLSISDLYASLGWGASVRLISSVEAMLAPWLARMITEWGITVWYSVPSILTSMLETGPLVEQGLPTVRLLFFAGEVFPTPQLRRLRRAVPRARLLNLFGPTETNVCTYYEVPADLPDDQVAPIPIGRACEHMETFVLGDDGTEVGIGVEGTLWARGGNLMTGYWNDPDRTAATLKPDPRGKAGLAYCTGDRVVLSPDGTYQFRGRLDHMIKIRGYRVELGEVETALIAHPEVLEAIAMPLENPAGTRLVASVLPRTGCHPDADAVRDFARRLLPAYMVPDRLEVRPSMPRTSTGKTDRRALRSEWESKTTP